jgi:hypothetical protein
MPICSAAPVTCRTMRTMHHTPTFRRKKGDPFSAANFARNPRSDSHPTEGCRLCKHTCQTSAPFSEAKVRTTFVCLFESGKNANRFGSVRFGSVRFGSVHLVCSFGLALRSTEEVQDGSRTEPLCEFRFRCPLLFTLPQGWRVWSWCTRRCTLCGPPRTPH